MPWPTDGTAYQKIPINKGCLYSPKMGSEGLIDIATDASEIAARWELAYEMNRSFGGDADLVDDMQEFRCEHLAFIANLLAPEKCPDKCVLRGLPQPVTRYRRIRCADQLGKRDTFVQ